MAFNFNYDPNNVLEYELLQDGVYKVRITDVDASAKSRSGNDMAVITLSVVGRSNTSIKYYLVAFTDAEKARITNRNLKRIYDSFTKIIRGSMPSQTWVGKVGMAHIIVDEYTGTDGEKHQSNKIDRFLPAEEEPSELGVSTDDLPF